MPSRDVEIMPIEKPHWLRFPGGESSRTAAITESSADLASISLEDPRSSYSRVPTAFQNLIFPGLWLLIGCISAIDTYLTVKFREHLMFLESNPIANILLDLDAGDPSILIGVKFLGSTVALGSLAALYLQNRRIGLMVSAGLACFQVGLLYYLLVM